MECWSAGVLDSKSRRIISKRVGVIIKDSILDHFAPIKWEKNQVEKIFFIPTNPSLHYSITPSLQDVDPASPKEDMGHEY